MTVCFMIFYRLTADLVELYVSGAMMLDISGAHARCTTKPLCYHCRGFLVIFGDIGRFGDVH